MNAGRIVLELAAAEIGIIGLIYLFAPAFMMNSNGMVLNGITETHTIRAAYGGAFVGFGLLFLLGALYARLTEAALVALVTFMGGFALGRIFSLVVDGMPVGIYLFVLSTEIILALAALMMLRRR